MSLKPGLLRGGPIDESGGWEVARSPLIDAPTLAEHRPALVPPARHTAAELGTIIAMLTQPDDRSLTVGAVSVGHSRDAASREAARAFIAAWGQRGEVIGVVDWPETAASWLRPATRLISQAPDAWVIAAAPTGFTQLARRLREQGDWDPARTVAFASLNAPQVLALAGPDTLHGMRGATTDGGIWHVRHRWIRTYPPTPSPAAEALGSHR